MRKFAKMAVAAAIAGMAMGAQATLVIDDFDGNAGVSLSDNRSNYTCGLIHTAGCSSTAIGDHSVIGLANNFSAPTGIVGMSRETFVAKTGEFNATGRKADNFTKFSTLGIATDAIGPGNSALDFANATGVSGVGVVRWDGTADTSFTGLATDTMAAFLSANSHNLNGGAGINLTQFGNQFRITVENSDQNFEFTINLYSGATNYSSLTLLSDGDGSQPIDFALFGLPAGTNSAQGVINHTGTGVNLTQVTSIEVIINDNVPASGSCGFIPLPGCPFDPTLGGTVFSPLRGLNLQIDMAQVVPEPGTMALTGFALVGLAAMRRRKGKAV